MAKFPDAEELAVTMTGELCDCFETKRDGVHAIIKAVRGASGGRPIRVWSTDGVFLNSEEAKANHMKVAAANWHALATFAGSYQPKGGAMLIDIGSTTTDIVPILDGCPIGKQTDTNRLEGDELVYIGVRRTPLCAILRSSVAAELFATTLDVYLLLNKIPEDPNDTDTADGRSATQVYAHARLARMKCSDPELMREAKTLELAEDAHQYILQRLSYGYTRAEGVVESQLPRGARFLSRIILSGSGEFLRATSSLSVSAI